jgi:hypothetical protein
MTGTKNPKETKKRKTSHQVVIENIPKIPDPRSSKDSQHWNPPSFFASLPCLRRQKNYYSYAEIEWKRKKG